LRVGRVTEVEVVYAKLLVKGVIGVGTSCEDAEQDLVAMSGEVATDGDGCRIERLESRCEQQVWCRQCTRCENHNRRAELQCLTARGVHPDNPIDTMA